MKIGVAYYPEHWPEGQWADDIRQMRRMGIEVVRLGGFAWSRLEPKRGQFDPGWLEDVIEILAAEGLSVILCTPTAAPPPWLFVRHPSMVPDDREGKPWYRGGRRHVCLHNRPYRRYVRRIMREMARTFARRPEVCAWQIDSELGCYQSGRCYCDDCEQAFREWLMRRYGIIDRLNRLWGAQFWSQHFNDWHEIPAPRRTPGGAHPSLVLDYQCFVSATYRDFITEQRKLIEQYSAGKPPVITTNSLGLHVHEIDQFALGSVQDVAGLDNCPADGSRFDDVALQLDLTRCVKRGAFWVLEQQAGVTGVPALRSQPRPGQLRLWSFQAAARGADLISYFRWRTCPYGQQMHWDGILGADGARTRRYEELAATMEALKGAAESWRGRLPRARVAMVLDYAAHWGLEANRMGAQLDYLEQFRAFHGLLRRAGFVTDILPPGQPLSEYALVVATMPIIIREADARLWGAFVEGGGTLLVTAPAGCRTEHNTTEPGPQPARLADLLGLEVEEYDVLGAGAANSVAFDDEAFTGSYFCSVLRAEGAEVLARYGREFYAGRPAVTRTAVGEGSAYFLGATGAVELYDRVLREALAGAGLKPSPWASATVEVVPLRTADDEPDLTFVLNHADAAAELEVPEGRRVRDLLSDREHVGTLRLEPYGVVLLQG